MNADHAYDFVLSELVAKRDMITQLIAQLETHQRQWRREQKAIAPINTPYHKRWFINVKPRQNPDSKKPDSNQTIMPIEKSGT